MRPSACGDVKSAVIILVRKDIIVTSLNGNFIVQTKFYVNMPSESDCQEFTQWIYAQNSVRCIMIFIKILLVLIK